MLIKDVISFSKLIKESAPVAATPRKNMKKIHQMSRAEFVTFLKALKSKLKGSSLDLTDLSASEKVDGQAARLGVMDGQVGAETSSSGLVFKPYKLSQDGHTKLLKHFQAKYKGEMLAIAEKFGDFKVICELFYIRNNGVIDEDGSITFVATKYDTSKLGSMGAIILFDAESIAGGSTVKMAAQKKEAVIAAVKSLSDDTFKVFDKNDISWKNTFNITIDFDTNTTEEIFNNPDILLKCGKELFEKFRDAVALAFSEEINKSGSVLGLSDSVVEGIVFEIDGNKFGATNFNWKHKKGEIHKAQTDMQAAIDNFYKDVFGTIYTKKVAEAIEADPEAYQNSYAAKLPEFQHKLETIMDEFTNTDNIPKNMKMTLMIILGTKYKKLMALTSDIGSLYEMLTKKKL